jgi:hypothetical protein
MMLRLIDNVYLRFRALESLHFGVKKDKFCDPIFQKPCVLVKLNYVVRCASLADAYLHCTKKVIKKGLKND